MTTPIKIASILLLFCFGSVNAQKIINPVIGSKTHPSLLLDSLDLGSDITKCYLSIINRNTEGNAWFCADNNIVIREQSNGKLHKLIRSENIPVCPDAHKFESFGEKLSFVLVFPALSDPASEIDIHENCADNCFSLNGVILNQRLNKEIREFENGVDLYNNENLDAARQIFSGLLLSEFKNENHYGYSLYVLPLIYQKIGKKDEAIQAFKMLQSSSIPQKEYFLRKLNEIDFFRSNN